MRKLLNLDCKAHERKGSKTKEQQKAGKLIVSEVEARTRSLGMEKSLQEQAARGARAKRQHRAVWCKGVSASRNALHIQPKETKLRSIVIQSKMGSI